MRATPSVGEALRVASAPNAKTGNELTDMTKFIFAETAKSSHVTSGVITFLPLIFIQKTLGIFGH